MAAPGPVVVGIALKKEKRQGPAAAPLPLPAESPFPRADRRSDTFTGHRQPAGRR